eukprot:753986-Hanusia_phi.AAC.5
MFGLSIHYRRSRPPPDLLRRGGSGNRSQRTTKLGREEAGGNLSFLLLVFSVLVGSLLVQVKEDGKELIAQLTRPEATDSLRFSFIASIFEIIL